MHEQRERRGEVACLGGMLFRFIPTTIAFLPAPQARYFPNVPEVLMTIGYIALAIVVFGIGVNYLAVLPGEINDWNYMFKLIRRRRQAGQSAGGPEWQGYPSTR